MPSANLPRNIMNCEIIIYLSYCHAPRSLSPWGGGVNATGQGYNQCCWRVQHTLVWWAGIQRVQLSKKKKKGKEKEKRDGLATISTQRASQTAQTVGWEFTALAPLCFWKTSGFPLFHRLSDRFPLNPNFFCTSALQCWMYRLCCAALLTRMIRYRRIKRRNYTARSVV